MMTDRPKKRNGCRGSGRLEVRQSDSRQLMSSEIIGSAAEDLDFGVSSARGIGTKATQLKK